MKHLLPLVMLLGCADQEVVQRLTVTRPLPPTVTLLVDTTAAMAKPVEPGFGGNRFDDVRVGLHRALSTHGHRFSLGLAMVGSAEACGLGRLLVAPSDPDNDPEQRRAVASQLDGWIQALPVGGSASLAYTFGVLANELPYDADREHYIVVVTSSDPDCGGNTIAGVTGLATRRVLTHVVGYGPEVEHSASLDAFARVGSPGRTCPQSTDRECGVNGRCDLLTLRCDRAFWAAPDSVALDEVFNQLFGAPESASPCRYRLETPPSNAERLTVTIDGVETAAGPDGWQLVNSDTVEFVGAACRQLSRSTTRNPVTVELRVNVSP